MTNFRNIKFAVEFRKSFVNTVSQSPHDFTIAGTKSRIIQRVMQCSIRYPIVVVFCDYVNILCKILCISAKSPVYLCRKRKFVIVKSLGRVVVFFFMVDGKTLESRKSPCYYIVSPFRTEKLTVLTSEV